MCVCVCIAQSLQQVKSADTCNSYRKTLQRTEKKLSECRQENSFLKERIDIIASSTIVSSGKETDDDAQQLRQLQQLEQKRIQEEKVQITVLACFVLTSRLCVILLCDPPHYFLML